MTYFNYNTDTHQLICQDDWTLPNLVELEHALKKLSSAITSIDGSKITKLDSAGAWLLTTLSQDQKPQNLSPQHQKLFDMVEQEHLEKVSLPQPEKMNVFAKIGFTVTQQFNEFTQYFYLIGRLTFEALRLLARPDRMRWKALAEVVYTTGCTALPIIALLSFMIGVVLSYQMGNQLRNYGANVFIVDLLGLSVLREFGPLLTAIMVAGRTGSAFTAQLGMMKINQEIDALNTMGVTPDELLLLPRIIGLFVVLPLLTIWADVFGVLGGMFMANNMLDINWYSFITRFQHSIPLRALIIGLGKAPVFALIIASIGCFEGMQVRGSADSVGRNTTRSVVLGIFFIIVADAIFSVIFSKLKL